MHRTKTRDNFDFTIIILIIIFLVGLLGIYFNSDFLSKDSLDVSENLDIKEEIIEDEIIRVKKYLGDIHFQLGIGEKDSIIIYLNKKEAFNSENNKERGVFQTQIFDLAYEGENLFEIEYENKDDGQPLVLFVIKDGKETIYNWVADNESGFISFNVDIK